MWTECYHTTHGRFQRYPRIPSPPEGGEGQGEG